jgi:hypothetical protein
MKYLVHLLSLVLVSLLWSCDTERIEPLQECVNNAVVEDFTGLDGCGYLFKLSNGEYLEPVRPVLYCGTPPIPDEVTNDPLWGFQFEHGKKVRIGFEYTNEYGSICMKGRTVVITCIETLENEVPEK